MLAYLCSFISPITTYATKWVHEFVVWNGYVYVLNDEDVTEIDKEIGQVTKYSDMEQLPGNFSNVYKKGTKYYSIKDISTDDAIAVEDGSGEYKKAVREKEYTFGGTDEDNSKGKNIVLILSVLLAFGLFIIFFIEKKLKR